MSKIIQLLILSSLCTIFTYGMDANSTNEIINKATEAVKELEVELNSVVNDEEEKVEEVVVETIPLETLVVEKNTSTLKTLSLESLEMIDEPVILEENRSIETQSLVNVELNKTIVENNVTTKVEDAELSVEKGDPKKGKNIFKYVLKEDCNMTAFQFADKHSQEEWIEILEEKKIKETIFESCPNVENYYQERWTDDLYQFFYEASNEDEIPEC